MIHQERRAQLLDRIDAACTALDMQRWPHMETNPGEIACYAKDAATVWVKELENGHLVLTTEWYRRTPSPQRARYAYRITSDAQAHRTRDGGPMPQKYATMFEQIIKALQLRVTYS